MKLITLTAGQPGPRPALRAGRLRAVRARDAGAGGASIDGAALTALRTGAVSGLATRWLAREDARRLVVFGAGRAGAGARRGDARRPRPRGRGDRLPVARHGGGARRARSAGASGRLEDVARGRHRLHLHDERRRRCSTGRCSRPGRHVNAVGAYTPETREVDTATVRRARVVVETREVAMAEAGDLLLPIAEGAVDADHVVADLAETGAGQRGSPFAEDVTLFVSVGMAFEDLVVARAGARTAMTRDGRRRRGGRGRGRLQRGVPPGRGGRRRRAAAGARRTRWAPARRARAPAGSGSSSRRGSTWSSRSRACR